MTNPIPTPDDLITLAAQWRAAKADEETARARRLAVEKDIETAVGITEATTGTFTAPAPGGALKIRCAMRDKWDDAKLAEIETAVPSALFPFEKTTVYKPDKRGVDYLRRNEPETFARLAPALTQTPAKPAFSFKPDEKD